MFKVADMGNVNTLASVGTIEMLTKDLKTLQDRLDSISRNVYIQQDIEKEHFECNFIYNNILKNALLMKQVQLIILMKKLY